MTGTLRVISDNRRRVLPFAVALALLAGLVTSLLGTSRAHADYYTGCNYGYSSNGTGFGSGSGIGYGYGYDLNGTFGYGYGNEVCPPSTTTTVVPPTSTTTVPPTSTTTVPPTSTTTVTPTSTTTTTVAPRIPLVLHSVRGYLVGGETETIVLHATFFVPGSSTIVTDAPGVTFQIRSVWPVRMVLGAHMNANVKPGRYEVVETNGHGGVAKQSLYVWMYKGRLIGRIAPRSVPLTVESVRGYMVGGHVETVVLRGSLFVHGRSKIFTNARGATFQIRAVGYGEMVVKAGLNDGVRNGRYQVVETNGLGGIAREFLYVSRINGRLIGSIRR